MMQTAYFWCPCWALFWICSGFAIPSHLGFSRQSVLLNAADSCYLYFYVLPPLSVSGAVPDVKMLG